MSAPDPLLAAGAATVRRSLAEMRQTIAEFPPNALNWKPGGEDTNSVAVLTTHSLHSTRSWLSTALGEPLPDRDRDSEFRVAEDNREKLLVLFDEFASQCNALFESPREVDWSAIRRT
ncbi:MAG TPA: DinB family protein, partial [Dehalococcoidia bacterium]|nr:DinB family protein [Dehalococcoidia bacterium]